MSDVQNVISRVIRQPRLDRLHVSCANNKVHAPDNVSIWLRTVRFASIELGISFGRLYESTCLPSIKEGSLWILPRGFLFELLRGHFAARPWKQLWFSFAFRDSISHVYPRTIINWIFPKDDHVFAGICRIAVSRFLAIWHFCELYLTETRMWALLSANYISCILSLLSLPSSAMSGELFIFFFLITQRVECITMKIWYFRSRYDITRIYMSRR